MAAPLIHCLVRYGRHVPTEGVAKKILSDSTKEERVGSPQAGK